MSQVIAVEQLMKEGAEVHAGNNVTFLFTDSENKRYHRRVIAEQLIEKGVKMLIQRSICFFCTLQLIVFLVSQTIPQKAFTMQSGVMKIKVYTATCAELIICL